MKALLGKLLLGVGFMVPTWVWSDIKLNAPGQSGQLTHYLSVNTVPFESHNNESNFVILPVYKFVFRGVEASLTTSGGSNVHLQAMVQYVGQSNTKERIDLDLHKKNGTTNVFSGTTLLNTPIEFRGNSGPVYIAVSWVGSGNVNKPDGFFNILGEYLPTPPKPTGSLSGLPPLVAMPGETVRVSGTANVQWE